MVTAEVFFVTEVKQRTAWWELVVVVLALRRRLLAVCLRCCWRWALERRLPARPAPVARPPPAARAAPHPPLEACHRIYTRSKRPSRLLRCPAEYKHWIRSKSFKIILNRGWITYKLIFDYGIYCYKNKIDIMKVVVNNKTINESLLTSYTYVYIILHTTPI